LRRYRFTVVPVNQLSRLHELFGLLTRTQVVRLHPVRVRKGNNMPRRTSLRRLSTTIRFGLPLAAVAALAVACGGSTGSTATGGGATSGSAPSSPAGGLVSVESQTGTMGTFLTDQTGKALYLYTPDTSSMSNCTGTCATLWPPVTTSSGMPSASGAATASKLGTITRADGTEQVTYAGHPLYYYEGDTKAGQTNGEGLMNIWFLLSPAGVRIAGPATGSAG
jgi:predicted lipoprotein with Yx(FWY)xxD motif